MIDKRWLFIADWLNPVFIHFAFDPQLLAPCIPFPLDCFDGSAYVSLVAFTQSRLRPINGGRIGQWLSTPLASHEFLNLRTYVRVDGQPAIYFLAEWIPNRVAVLLGPALYGLPYRLGEALDYHRDVLQGRVHGSVRAMGSRLAYRGQFDPRDLFHLAQPDSLHHFLLERYVAFTRHRSISRRFDVRHSPWPIVPVNLRILDDSLLSNPFPWFRHVQLAAAHYSPGVRDVHISRPLLQSRGNRVHYRAEQETGAATDVQSPCRSRGAETIRPGPGAVQ